MRDSRPDEPTSTQPAGDGKAPERKQTNWAIPVLIVLFIVIAWSIAR